MEEKQLAESLTRYERSVLPHITKKTEVNEIVQKSGLQEIEVLRALQWLVSKELIDLEDKTCKSISLGKNGQKYREEGLPEIKFLKSLTEPLVIPQIRERTGLSETEIKISLGLLRKKAAINIKKKEGSILIEKTKAGEWLLGQENKEQEFLNKEFPLDMSVLDADEANTAKNLLKRKGILEADTRKEFYASITKIGKSVADLSKTVSEQVEALTHEMLKGGEWKDKSFRKFDVRINVPAIDGGKQHFVSQAIDYIRRIWLELGFTEVTGSVVQTAFWDLDALFVPQDHPARDEQDTYFLENPKKGKIPAIWRKVKSMHEKGGEIDSKGWGGKYSRQLAEQVLLITHDTYLSAKVLAKTKEEDLPIKTFQVMKVFRNEALDWKHLFEFYQVGGIVADKNANFRNLLWYLQTFFKKMGYDQIRIRPGSFPYTEPSAEIEVHHPTKRQWIELGGCGMFRPEVVVPLMGFECPVLAWGFGMARIIADYWGITDIRDLYRNDLKQIRETKTWLK